MLATGLCHSQTGFTNQFLPASFAHTPFPELCVFQRSFDPIGKREVKDTYTSRVQKTKERSLLRRAEIFQDLRGTQRQRVLCQPIINCKQGE